MTANVTEMPSSGDQRPAAPGSSPGAESLVVHSSFDQDRRVVAVTGANSFLGGAIIQRLEEDRRVARVVAIDIKKPELPLAKTHFHKVDLTLPNADAEVALVLKQAEVETLVHLAFLSRPTHNLAWAHEFEAIGTLHVLNACAACRVRKVVMKSITLLYGASPSNPNHLGEEQPTQGLPDSPFLKDKIEAERLAKRFRKENPSSTVTILRTAPILGRRIRNFISWYLSMPVVPVLMGFDPLFQFLHEEDAVDAFKHCIDRDFDGEFNVVGPGVLPLGTVLALAGRVPLPIPRSLAAPVARTMWLTQVFDTSPAYLDYLRYACIADGEKCRQKMGFVPRRDIREIIEEFAFGRRAAGGVAGRAPDDEQRGAVHER